MPTYLSPGVYVEEVQSGARPLEGVGTAVAAFVGLAEEGPFNEPTLVSSWTAFTGNFGGFVPGSYLAQSVYGYFMNGGGNCYVVRIGQNGSTDPAKTSRSGKALPAGPQAILGRLRVAALDPSVPAGELSIEITEPGGEAPTEEMFRVVVKRGGEPVEEFDRVSLSRGKTNVATVVNAASNHIRIEEVSGAALDKPATGETSLADAPPPATLPAPRLNADDYVGDVADRTGFGGLETIDEVTMLCVPDLMSAYQQGSIDLETVQAVQLAMIAHCELMGDRIAILDSPPGLNAQQVKEWRVDKAGYDSMFAALYYPWIKTANPSNGQLGFMPPSGHMAGIWSRNDDTRGVHKAPANEVIRGVVSLEMRITKNEHDLLNPVGINCLRTFPGRGNRVWGARTLSSDPAWRYLNIRRLVQLSRGVDPQRHQLGRLRAQRPGAVGTHPAHHRGVPGQRMAQGRPVRPDAGRGLLRQVRLGDQPRRGNRRRPGRLRDRRRTGQARRVRDLPPVAVLGRHQPGQRVTRNLQRREVARWHYLV